MYGITCLKMCFVDGVDVKETRLPVAICTSISAFLGDISKIQSSVRDFCKKKQTIQGEKG